VQPHEPGRRRDKLLFLKGQIFGTLTQLNGDGVSRTFIEEVLGGPDDMEVAEADPSFPEPRWSHPGLAGDGILPLSPRGRCG